jgi:hypothetical protein
MGQKITEYPQVDLWLRHTREADKAGATLPYRESSNPKELSKYAEMERARHRSVFFSGWSAPVPALAGPDPDEDEEPDDEDSFPEKVEGE